jgi:gamma-glutamyltranspeptidase/glutathione hydrolase
VGGKPTHWHNLIQQCPPNGQGITALIALGIIEAYEDLHDVDILKMGHNSAEYLHLLIESLRWVA